MYTGIVILAKRIEQSLTMHKYPCLYPRLISRLQDMNNLCYYTEYSTEVTESIKITLHNCMKYGLDVRLINTKGVSKVKNTASLKCLWFTWRQSIEPHFFPYFAEINVLVVSYELAGWVKYCCRYEILAQYDTSFLQLYVQTNKSIKPVFRDVIWLTLWLFHRHLPGLCFTTESMSDILSYLLII